MKSAAALSPVSLVKYLGLIILPATILILTGQIVKTKRRWYKQIAASVFIVILVFVYVLVR
jgi:hypothetical protein